MPGGEEASKAAKADAKQGGVGFKPYESTLNEKIVRIRSRAAKELSVRRWVILLIRIKDI